ncbi:MAG: SusC/RagA family TonB-linked outer membrane protein, partial [Longimicrobiales bacterium]
MSGWMARTTAVLTLLLGATSQVHAQATGTISGTVVDARTGEGIVGAQVHIPNTSLGVITAANGEFILPNVPVGEQTVRMQSLGYEATEQTVTVVEGETVRVTFSTGQQAIDMEEIVVTALGITRSERGLGSAVQSLDADAIAKIPTLNVAQALQGRASGVQVTRTSSRPGAASRVVIRGESSFTGGGQPLWVIDGVPIEMETEPQGGDFGPEAGEAGSRAMDIDMNNVEEMSVLRGAAATALYGSRAAHGAIIIRTKGGQAGGPTRFTVNTRYSTHEAMLKGIQETYTAGRSDPETGQAYYCNGLPDGYGGWCESGYYQAGFQTPTTNNAWGPRYDQLSPEVREHECPGETDPAKCLRLIDPRKDFYGTGHVLETSVNASGGLGDRGSFSLSGTNVSDQGIQPNTSLDRLNLSANVTLRLTDRFQSVSNVMYSDTRNAWLTEGWQGTERQLQYLTNTIDVRTAWNEDGTPVMWGANTPHPAWIAENESRTSKTGRWIASQRLSFDITDRLTLSNQLGFDTYLENRTFNQNERPWRTAEGDESGSTRQERHTRTSINNDLVLTLSNTPLSEVFTVSGLAGFNILARSNDNLIGEGDDIVIPGFYSVSNFLDQDVTGDLRENRRLMGVYGQATIDYRDWAYLNLTARNDWSSTLPKENNSYFYPSAALSMIFTDALGIRNRWLDYGKVRLSVAKVGSDAPPYRLATTYNQAGGVEWPFNGTLGFVQSGTLGNPELRPESTTEYEVGLELRGLGGRGSIDLSYYDKRSYDQIFEVPSSAATGYDEIVRNAGDLRNEGIEATLRMVPIQTAKARWDLALNWSRNESSVIELAPGVESIHLAGYSWPSVQIREGAPYGVIYGEGWQRTADGEIVIDDDPESDTYGWPVLDENLLVIGNSQPDWLGNLSTAFTYGPFTVSGLL